MVLEILINLCVAEPEFLEKNFCTINGGNVPKIGLKGVFKFKEKFVH